MIRFALAALLLIVAGHVPAHGDQKAPGSDCAVLHQGKSYVIACPGQPPQPAAPFGAEDLMVLPTAPASGIGCTDTACTTPRPPTSSY